MMDTKLLKEKLKDRTWRMSHLYQIIDKEGEAQTLKPNWMQQELIQNLHNRNIVLKARQLGSSTFFTLLALDHCLFSNNQQATIIAHKLGDAKELFRKIRFAYDHLPSQLKRLTEGDHDAADRLSFSNGSSVNTTVSGRSGTIQFLHVTELSYLDFFQPQKANELITGSLAAVHQNQFAVIESTARGRSGYFYDMCKEAMKSSNKDLTALDWKFHFFPWWKEPSYRLATDSTSLSTTTKKYAEELKLKDSIQLDPQQLAWYERQYRTLGEHILAEYPSTPEEAFAATVQGAYYAEDLQKASRDGRVTHIPYDQALPVHTFWDLGMNDETVILFVQFFHSEIRILDCYANSGEPLAHYVKIIKQKPYAYGGHWFPHDVAVRDMATGVSREETLRAQGIQPKRVPRIKSQLRTELIEGINAVKTAFTRLYIHDSNCKKFIEAIGQYRQEYNPKTNTYRDHPHHDWTSNYADALRYCIVSSKQAAIPPIDAQQQQRIQQNRSRSFQYA